MTLVVASLAFFLSGFAALIYQIVWQRLLVLPMGADVYSTTVIVAAFMTGLGLGSMAGGQFADRLTRSGGLKAFILAECAVGLFGLFSRSVFYDWQYLSLSAMALPQGAMIAVVFATLLWPTFWMGVSLPVLARAVSETLGSAATRVGVLYGLNTLGAAAGAFLATWILMPRLGLDGGIRVAAISNLLAAPALGSACLQPALAFLLLQAFVGLYTGLSIVVLVALLESGRAIPILSTYLMSFEPLDAAAAFASLSQPGPQRSNFVVLYAILPALLVGPPTIALGASFPLLQRIVLVDLARLGRRVGTVLLANIAGSAAGSIVTGWFALTWLGTATSLRVLTAGSGGFLALAVLVAMGRASVVRRSAAWLASAVAIAALTMQVPGTSRLWATLHGTLPPWIVHDEDASGVSRRQAHM